MNYSRKEKRGFSYRLKAFTHESAQNFHRDLMRLRSKHTNYAVQFRYLVIEPTGQAIFSSLTSRINLPHPQERPL